MKRLILLSALATGNAEAAYFPMYSSWPQPAGPGSAIELSYSYANLLHGNILDARSGQPIAADLLRSAFEAALRDYAEILPITFREVADAGPAPESGEYYPTGLADIRIGQVAHIDGANAYAYFPHEGSGLAGDIVFNAERFGNDWSLALFYGVAQHELGHSLGMGHALDENAAGGDGQLSAYNGPLFALQDDMISALQAVYGTGQGNVIPLTPATVPLPAAIWLMPFGLSLLGAGRFHRRSARQLAGIVKQ
ncbi:matrixin family metalloprotease [Methylomonas sp. 2BW1-5-20]|uniref:matrixin family metalloprotease n=1 Tax=Methylomonas sp. 2BW1-5-20 TaxID=3376686 RepID=UPI00404EB8DB